MAAAGKREEVPKKIRQGLTEIIGVTQNTNSVAELPEVVLVFFLMSSQDLAVSRML